jgi:hypothetical protein
MVQRTQLREALERMGNQFGFTRDVIDSLVLQAHPRLVRRDRGLVGCGDWTHPVVFLLEGAARLEMHDPTTRTVIVSLIPAGRFIVPAAAPRRRDALIRAVAHVRVGVAIVEAAAMAGALVRLPTASLAPHERYLARPVASSLEALPATAVAPAGRTHLARQLDTLAAEFGRPVAGGIEIVLPLTHTHLARLVGGSRAAVCRALKQLGRMGRVAVIGNRFVLPIAHELHLKAG